MRKQRSDGQDTRLRLLDAACEVFAARGFWEATVAEICKLAKANTAAVNYHFGGKETLYVESWKHAFRRSLAKYPVDGGVAADAPPPERLKGRVLSLMRRVVDPQSHSFDIAHKEMASPTGLLAKAMKESLDPQHKGLAALIRELLGEGASERQVRLCRMSVMSQCFGPLLKERGRLRLGKTFHHACPEPFLDDVDTLADHVARFCLAGITEVRRQIARPASDRRSKQLRNKKRSPRK